MNKLTEKEDELYRRVDEVLYYVWDPIGVCSYPEARDEYQSYIPQIFSMLKNTKTKKEIVEYLTNLSKDQMGLDLAVDKTEDVADLLIQWKEIILDI
jgi:hypothetical protein